MCTYIEYRYDVKDHLSSSVTAIGLRVFLNFQRLFKYEVDTEILIYLVRLLPNIYKLIVDTYFGKGMYIYYIFPINYLLWFWNFPFLVQPMSILISTMMWMMNNFALSQLWKDFERFFAILMLCTCYFRNDISLLTTK